MLNLDLSGQTALITGASGDLGVVMATTLAACGANVGLHYLSSKERAERVRDQIRSAGGNAEAFQADITDEASVAAMKQAVNRELGVPTILVASAVIQYEWMDVLSQPLEDFESQFRSCILHNALIAKAFLPDVVATGKGGRYIGINTECAMQCFPGQSAYAAGKRGMDGLLRVLAKEMGPHQITVNQVAPGWTLSERVRQRTDDPQAGYIKNVPMARAGTDQEIANVVAFLASDLASFITGAYVPVCGGNVMPTI